MSLPELEWRAIIRGDSAGLQRRVSGALPPAAAISFMGLIAQSPEQALELTGKQALLGAGRGTAVDYLEERQTGWIYSVRELGRMLRSRQLDMREVTRRFRPLPSGTALLLEEADAIAARAEEDPRRWWLKPGRS